MHHEANRCQLTYTSSTLRNYFWVCRSETKLCFSQVPRITPDTHTHTHPQVIIFVLHPIETDCLFHTGLMTVVFFLGKDCNYSPDCQGGEAQCGACKVSANLYIANTLQQIKITTRACVFLFIFFKYCSLERHMLVSVLRASGWFSSATRWVLSATLCTVVCPAVLCHLGCFVWVRLAPPLLLLSVCPAHLLPKQLLLFLSSHTVSLHTPDSVSG